MRGEFRLEGGRLPFNHGFFNTVSKTQQYVLGVFYHGFLPFKKEGFIFRSSRRSLVELVKKKLDMPHAIIKDPRGYNTFFLQLPRAVSIRTSLNDIGMQLNKSERRIPSGILWMDHFLRGFTDAAIRGRERIVSINFKSLFLNDYVTKIEKYCQVKCVITNKNCISLGKKKIKKLYQAV